MLAFFARRLLNYLNKYEVQETIGLDFHISFFQLDVEKYAYHPMDNVL